MKFAKISGDPLLRLITKRLLKVTQMYDLLLRINIFFLFLRKHNTT